jgi:hypothetical protein
MTYREREREKKKREQSNQNPLPKKSYTHPAHRREIRIYNPSSILGIRCGIERVRMSEGTLARQT